MADKPAGLSEIIATVREARGGGETGTALVERLGAAMNPPEQAAPPEPVSTTGSTAPAEPVGDEGGDGGEPIDPRLVELLSREPAAKGKPGDPPGSYRDELDRLRREDNDALLPEPKESKAPAQITTETPEQKPAAGLSEEGELRPIKLPGREGAAEYEFKPSNPEEAQRLRMLVNSYSTRAALNAERAEFAESQEEFGARVRLIQSDPVGFIMEQLETGDQAGIAQRILAALPEAEFKKVIELATAWAQDGLMRENVVLRATKESDDRRKKFDRDEDTRKRQAAAVNKIVQEVYKLVPEEMSDTQADRFYRVALSDLEAYLSVPGNRGTLTPDKVAAVLKTAGTLELFGLDAGDGAKPAEQPKPGKKTAPAPAATVKRAKEAGPEFRKRTETRRAAAAVTPAGSGAAAAAAPSPPEGQTVKERIGWAKKFFGK